MTKYLTAKQLGILPEERAALIDFVKAPALGRTIALNGRAHYYDQSNVDMPDTAKESDCGTAGCVAGYVFAHARRVQKKRTLRGADSARTYIGAAQGDYDITTGTEGPSTLFSELYGEGGDRKLPEAKRVVDKMLRTGKVLWR